MRTCRVLLIVLAITAPAPSQQVDWRSWPVRSHTPRDYDVRHYRIQLRFDHSKKQYFGTCTITLVPVRKSIRSCTFDAEIMTVRSVTTEQGTPLLFERDPGSVTVDLGREVPPSETLRVTFQYDGRQIDIDPDRWGVSRNYHVGIEFFDSTADHPDLISTLSFPEGARHWFPCNDHPSDKATQETILEVPPGWKAASNGSLLGVDSTSGGMSTFHWLQARPHSTYLFVVAAGPYVVLPDSLGQLPLAYWVYPQQVNDARRSFHRTPEIIRFFEQTYGVAYPWSKYDQILIPGISGGAESTTATVLGQSTIHDERADQDFPSHWLVAHEAAHQWWGDLVTFKDWGDSWINESFATYSEYLYARWSLGEDEGAVNLNAKREAYFREARTKYRRPIVMDRWRFPNDNFDAHTYPKGANVLHMLRKEMGEDAFLGFLKNVLTGYAFGSATTPDLLAEAEAAAGTELSWFFDQWLLAAGHPVLSVSWRWDAAKKAALLRVEQTQDTTGGIPIYTFPVDLGVTTTHGHRQERIIVKRRIEEFALPSPTRPILLEFDEPHNLLAEISFPRPPEELIVQLQQGGALSRIFAANLLTEFVGDPVVAAALVAAGREDSFWGVRKAAVTALSSKESHGWTAFLRERLSDTSSNVRSEAVRGLGRVGSRDIVSKLRSHFESESSYVVQADIVRVIGRLGDSTMAPFLQQASRQNSPRGIIRTAALQALKELRH